MQVREKVGKSRFTVFFRWFVARWSGGCEAIWTDGRWKIARRCGAKHISKSKCTKHTMFGALLEVEMSKKRTLLRREAHFQVKMYKTHHVRSTFGSWDVEKAHAVKARSTFPSQNVQDTPCPEHFWKLRCRKSARRCGAKHILGVRTTFWRSEVEKCTLLWREADFEAKSVKNYWFWAFFDIQMSKKCTPLWRERHFEAQFWAFFEVHMSKKSLTNLTNLTNTTNLADLAHKLTN